MKKILQQLVSLSDQLDTMGDYTMADAIDNLLIKTAAYADPKERFWAKVNKTPGCWLWMGAKDSGGYGICTINGKNYSAHKLSWQWTNNKPVPAGQVLLHTCDTPNCVNPKHLTPDTQINNVLDRVKKNRSAKGKNNGRAKLKEKDVKKIRKLRQKGFTEGQIAKMFDIGRSTVSNILKQRTWSWMKD